MKLERRIGYPLRYNLVLRRLTDHLGLIRWYVWRFACINGVRKGGAIFQAPAYGFRHTTQRSRPPILTTYELEIIFLYNNM